jgi:large subunit ribosomal protein L6
MSRIGKMSIIVPDGVNAKIEGNKINVSGPKGELFLEYLPIVNFIQADKQINISVKNPESAKEKPYWGLYRALIANMIKGVVDGYQKKLQFDGVGYSASCSGQNLTLNLGFSHPVKYILPKGISAIVEKNIITISGIDKQVVGQVAAEIRKMKKVDPYKLKGIKYIDEIVIKKAGKLAKAVGK